MVSPFQPARSYEEVAKLMTAQGHPITPPGVRVIERRALEKMRKEFEKRGITSITDLIRPSEEKGDVFSTPVSINHGATVD